MLWIISATIGLDSYEWYSINQSAIISNNNLINVASNDSYFVVVTNDGCTAISDTVTISVIAIPDPTNVTASGV